MTFSSGNKILLDPQLTAIYDTSVKGLSSNFRESRKSDYVAIKLMCKNRSLSICILLIMFLEKAFSKFVSPKYEMLETVLRLIDNRGEFSDR